MPEYLIMLLYNAINTGNAQSLPLTVTCTGAVASLGKWWERDITRILYTPNWLTDMVWEVPVTSVVVVVVPTVT